MTRKFAEECIELLGNVPGHRLPFVKFIPAYHKQFKRQCRFADYGFTTLIEMFAAIPDTVQMTKEGAGKKIVRLNPKYLDKNSGRYKSRQGLDSSQGYGNMGCRVFKQGCKIGNIFAKKPT